ncbi:MAG: CDP-diacylglycerol--glycerol-3-phosphate 3-phosphatidyltransferase [Hyphomicrobiales bacterium]
MADLTGQNPNRKSGARSSAITSLPNLLTYGRIAAVPLMAACFFFEGDAPRWIALALYTAACITDFFDGYLARIWNMQSSLGRMLDPIADKLLISVTILMLVSAGTIHGIHLWAAMIILCREVLVSGLREFLAEVQVSVPVTYLAKCKTTLQMIALGFLIAGEAGDKVLPHNQDIGLAGLWIAACLTLYTGYDYFRAGITHIVDE